jgi:hypothetical protein
MDVERETIPEVVKYIEKTIATLHVSSPKFISEACKELEAIHNDLWGKKEIVTYPSVNVTLTSEGYYCMRLLLRYLAPADLANSFPNLVKGLTDIEDVTTAYRTLDKLSKMI